MKVELQNLLVEVLTTKTIENGIMAMRMNSQGSLQRRATCYKTIRCSCLKYLHVILLQD